MNFLLDDNLPIEARDLFRAAGHDAVSAHELGLGGRTDAELVAACQAQERCLVTLDAAFSSRVAYPPGGHVGLIVLPLEVLSRRGVLLFVSRALSGLKRQDVNGHLWIVERDRIRVRGTE